MRSCKHESQCETSDGIFRALSLTKIPSNNIELVGKQQFVTQFVVLIGKLFLAGLCNIKKPKKPKQKTSWLSSKHFQHIVI